MYGSPTEHFGPLDLVRVDFPKPLAWVKDDALDEKPPIEVLGPIADDRPPQDAPRRVPTGVDVNGRIASFQFEPALEQGRYHVIVNKSRFRLEGEDGSPELYENGNEWSGWELNVYQNVEPQGPDPVPAPIQRGVTGISLDGTHLPEGASEISGEVLEVRSNGPVELRIEIIPLTSGASTSGYEQNLQIQEVSSGEPDEEHVYHLTSSGPLNGRRWAAYLGRRTEGEIPLAQDGRIAHAEALVRKPYDVLTTDPNPDTDGEEGEEITTMADFDLPINARVRLYADGEQVWWGQTRLIPLFVSVDRYLLMTEGRDSQSLSPKEIADLRVQLWRASREAWRLWECRFPDYVPSSIEEYVMTRMAYGWPRESGTQGDVFVRLGDQAYRGTSDKALARKLKQLADLLEDCALEAPLFPEDGMHTDVARVASEADYPRHHPGFRGHNSPQPTYDQDRFNPRRRRDPDQFDRRSDRNRR